MSEDCSSISGSSGTWWSYIEVSREESHAAWQIDFVDIIRLWRQLLTTAYHVRSWSQDTAFLRSESGSTSQFHTRLRPSFSSETWSMVWECISYVLGYTYPCLVSYVVNKRFIVFLVETVGLASRGTPYVDVKYTGQTLFFAQVSLNILCFS